MDQFGGLFTNRPCNFRMTMPQAADSYPGQKIKELPAVSILKHASFAFYQNGREPVVCLDKHLITPFYPPAVAHVHSTISVPTPS